MTVVASAPRSQDEGTLAELAGEPMVGFNDPDDRGIMRIVSDLAAASDMALNVRCRVSGVTDILGLAAAGQGFGIIAESSACVTLPGVCYRPLSDPGAVAELWYVWRHDRLTPAVDHLLAMVKARQPNEGSLASTVVSAEGMRKGGSNRRPSTSAS